MSVEANQLLGIAGKVLSTAGIHDYTNVQITYAMKLLDEWRVSISFGRRSTLYKNVASFSVDMESGEITGIWLDRTWK